MVIMVCASTSNRRRMFARRANPGSRTFTARQILPTAAGAGNVSQLHAMAAADINGDGLTDIVVGKRY